MYKCGWNGCEKAYGTLNHLNAHVTMQSHGTKRTPEGKLIIIWILFHSRVRLLHAFLSFLFTPVTGIAHPSEIATVLMVFL